MRVMKAALFPIWSLQGQEGGGGGGGGAQVISLLRYSLALPLAPRLQSEGRQYGAINTDGLFRIKAFTHHLQPH